MITKSKTALKRIAPQQKPARQTAKTRDQVDLSLQNLVVCRRSGENFVNCRLFWLFVVAPTWIPGQLPGCSAPLRFAPFRSASGQLAGNPGLRSAKQPKPPPIDKIRSSAPPNNQIFIR